MPRALLFGLLLSLFVAGCVPTVAPPERTGQDPSQAPTFGSGSFATGSDTQRVSLLAGGPLQASYPDRGTGRPCGGYFAAAPDYRVAFGGGRADLTFFAESQADTVLLIRSPDGTWHCNDDSLALNPALSFARPDAGRYDIWVGTYAATPGGYPPATLGITEDAPFDGTFDRAFFGADDRVVVSPRRAPWSMIGQLELSNGMCTAALIGPSTVLTSAHCISNNRGRESRPVAFRAGYAQGRSVAESAATGYHIPAGWRRGGQDGYDFAFVDLAQPIGNRVGWMDVTPLSAAEQSALRSGSGLALMQGGYSFDQSEVMTANMTCPFIEITRANTLVHQCDTLQGDSGSPLFIESGGRYRIVGVESRTDVQPGQQFDRNVAMYTDYIVRELARLGRNVTTRTAWVPTGLPAAK